MHLYPQIPKFAFSDHPVPADLTLLRAKNSEQVRRVTLQRISSTTGARLCEPPYHDPLSACTNVRALAFGRRDTLSLEGCASSLESWCRPSRPCRRELRQLRQLWQRPFPKPPP